MKTITTIALCLCSTLTLAKTVNFEPKNPSSWGYITAYIVKNSQKMPIGPITIKPFQAITLEVIAMNIHPKMANSCKNLNEKIFGFNAKNVTFQLKKDWLVHCLFS